MGVQAAIDKCVESLNDSPPSLEACEGVPTFVVELLCADLGLPACPTGAKGNSGPGLPLPSVDPTTALPSVGLPIIGGGLPGLGRTGTEAWADASQGGPTIAQLTSVYDPALVSLLVPGMVVSR